VNISLFYDWVEEGLFGEGELAHLAADIVDEATARDAPGEFEPGERVEEALLESAWRAAEDEQPLVRARTAVLLGRLGYAPAAPALDQAEQSDDGIVANAAAIVLGRLRGVDEERLAKLIAVTKDPAASRELRTAAAQSVALTHTPEAIAELIRIATSEDSDLAQYGLEGLGHAKIDPVSPDHDRAFEALMAALEVSDSALQSAAAEALGQFGDTSAIKPLEAVLIERDPTVRRRALFALAKLGAESAKPPLIRMVRDFSVPARWEIIDLLGRYYGEMMAETVAVAAEDKDPEIRDHVVAALGRMKGPGSLQLLEKIAQADKDDFVREQAENALDRRREQMAAGPEPADVLIEELAEPEGAAPPPPEPAPVEAAPPPPRPTSRLRPLFAGEAEPEPAAEPGAEESKTALEQALESMECSWWLDGAGYQVDLSIGRDKVKASILLGEVDYDDAPLYRFLINCGRVRPGSFEPALRNNRDLDYGSLAIADINGAPCYMLVDTLLVTEASTTSVRKTLTSLAHSAIALRG